VFCRFIVYRRCLASTAWIPSGHCQEHLSAITSKQCGSITYLSHFLITVASRSRNLSLLLLSASDRAMTFYLKTSGLLMSLMAVIARLRGSGLLELEVAAPELAPHSFFSVRAISLLCTHRAYLCGHHALEAAQGKASQAFLQAVATRESRRQQVVVGGGSR
jgi:hypothetical protein